MSSRCRIELALALGLLAAACHRQPPPGPPAGAEVTGLALPVSVIASLMDAMPTCAVVCAGVAFTTLFTIVHAVVAPASTRNALTVGVPSPNR